MWILVIFVIAFIIYLYMQSSRVYERKLEVSKKDLPGSFRFVQITDFHVNPWVDLEIIREKILAFHPHVIFTTGDMVDHACEEKRAMELFEILLSVGVPVVSVVGNHDLKPGVVLPEEMKKTEILLLENAATELNLGGVRVHIAGLSYPATGENYEAIIDSDADFTFLLLHAPLPAKAFLDARTDLALAGHTHGGQARLPFLGAWYASGEGFFPSLDKGMYEIGGSRLFISSGLGNTLAPIRVGNPVEIVFGKVVSE